MIHALKTKALLEVMRTPRESTDCSAPALFRIRSHADPRSALLLLSLFANEPHDVSTSNAEKLGLSTAAILSLHPQRSHVDPTHAGLRSPSLPPRGAIDARMIERRKN